jgi:hypothetical protein
MRGYMIMRKLIGVLALSALAATVLASPASAGPPEKQTEAVNYFGGGAVPDAEASLVRTNSGVSMRMSTTVDGQLFDLFAGPLGVDWEVGDATTNWFVVFNEPDECTPLPGGVVAVCGEDDVQNAAMGSPAAGVGVHFATGHIAGSSKWRSAASLREGDVSGIVFGLPLVDAMTAEIHIVARSHGPAANLVPGNLAAAIGSLNGGCAGPPEFGPNTCGDAQAAEFKPPTP